MRYLLAMIGAIAGALATTIFLSWRMANWVVATKRFDSPDQVSNLEDTVFIITSAFGLLVGWLIGWALGGALSKDDQDKTVTEK